MSSLRNAINEIKENELDINELINPRDTKSHTL